MFLRLVFNAMPRRHCLYTSDMRRGSDQQTGVTNDNQRDTNNDANNGEETGGCYDAVATGMRGL